MPPLLIDLHVDSSVPAYRQIADGIRRHLVAGHLAPGALLPPIRQLAMDLGVHFNTVAQAYRALADEGWLDLRRRRGAMVMKRNVPRKADNQKVAALTARIRDIAAELRSLGLSQAQVAVALERAGKQTR